MELENYVSNVCENNFASESFKPKQSNVTDRLFQKRVVCTKFDIYVSILNYVNSQIIVIYLKLC